MTNTKQSLKEILEHLTELSNNGLSKSFAFDQAHDEYIRRVSEEENSHQITSALDFLKTGPSIGTISVEYLIEVLEEKFLTSAQTQE